MFRCQKCKKVSKPREKAEKEVVEIREREYKNEIGEMIGVGTEIVKELWICAACKKG